MLNGDLVYFKTPEERLDDSVSRGSIMDLIYISMYGLKAYLDKKSSVFNNIDRSDPSGQRKYEAFLARINEYNCPVHQVQEDGVLHRGFNQLNGNVLFCFGRYRSMIYEYRLRVAASRFSRLGSMLIFTFICLVAVLIILLFLLCLIFLLMYNIFTLVSIL